MSEQLSKINETPEEEIGKIQPADAEINQPTPLTEKQDQELSFLLSEAQAAEKNGDLQTSYTFYKQYQEFYQKLREEFNEKESPVEINEKQGVEFLSKLLDMGTPKTSIAGALSGCDSKEAWALREELISRGLEPFRVLHGLAGVDSEKAWELRDQALDEYKQDRAKVNIDGLLWSLNGLDSDQAWEMRDALMPPLLEEKYVIGTINGCTSQRSWKVRDEKYEEEPYLIGGTFRGDNSLQAWEMREKLGKLGVTKFKLVASLGGINSPRAWEMREAILPDISNHDAIYALSQSLIGIGSDRAWEIRKEIIEDKTKNLMHVMEIFTSVAGMGDKKSWDFRNNILDRILKDYEGLTNGMELLDELADSVFGSAIAVAARIARKKT